MKNQDSKHSICFLGTGRINAKHVGLLKKMFPKLRLGIASRELDRAKEFQRRFNLSASFGTYSEAIRSDFSTVVIGVPPRHHFELIRDCLKAGKNLLIEKPIVNSLEEFKQLWPQLKNHPGVVMVAENQWFDPFHRKLKTILQKNNLGRPLFFDLVRLGVQKRNGWRADPKEMPLGALHEGGVHWIRRLLDLTNLYESNRSQVPLGVHAFGSSKETVMVMARHPSGLVSRLYHSWSIPRRTCLDLSKLQLEKGSIYFEGRGLFGLVFGGGFRFLKPELGDLGGFKAMWRDFIDSLERGKKPSLTLEEIFLDFSYLDAAVRSLASGREEVPEGIPQ